MKKIKTVFEFCPNYIYHMLSISNCGYKNQYGGINKNLHNQNDLRIINEASILLTVSGGSHMGKLYNIIVSNPAGYFSDEIEGLKEYYILTGRIFEKKYEKRDDKDFTLIYDVFYNILNQKIDLQQISSELLTIYTEEEVRYAINICKIFEKNIEIYQKNYFENEKIKAESVIQNLNKFFSQKDYISILEEIISVEYPYDRFVVSLVSSIENGPQAIDVSPYKDIFFAFTPVEQLIDLIIHEIIIFILKSKIEIKLDYNYWLGFESLAGFFHRKLKESEGNCNIKSWYGDDKIIHFYEDEYKKGNKDTLLLFEAYKIKYNKN